MLQSMTGFGKAVCELPNKIVNIEIRSLNSKQADVYLKLPALFKEAETELRSELMKKLVRGKIEFSIFYEMTTVERKTVINQPVLLDYMDQLRSLEMEEGVPGNEILLPLVMRLPDVFIVERQEFDLNEWKKIQVAIQSAIELLIDYRTNEGQQLAVDIQNRINGIQSMLPEIEAYEPERINRIRERMGNNLEEFLGKDKVDENRIEQEIILYLEKLDITEEKVRLKSHCNYFLETMALDEPIGKKLGFITQEIGREINTIGSKANDKDIQQTVVRMKDELEKIKEQLLNVL